ncbi:unnamed protein product [Caenorhabditis auriculariae]|uniref:Large ribosomal subunit protein uL22m n=1 Tax=Caenorhabditis auriculariae TaxID=2777116 RepID=A0A8S1HZJ5_9PELO|nr:unnamed protein product [Caenorhabditis auriculariae]
MISELFTLIVLAFILMTFHRADIAKGGEGVPFLMKFTEEQNKKKKADRMITMRVTESPTLAETAKPIQSKELKDQITTEEEEKTQSAGEPIVFETFEPTMKAPERKHHHHRVHRTREESASMEFTIMLRAILRAGGEVATVSRSFATSSASSSTFSPTSEPIPKVSPEDLSAEDIWERRLKLRTPKLQRDEKLSSKVYYAPEWALDKKPNRDEGFPDPLKNYGMTPEKWEYYNKVVWPPNYVVPETGLPKSREVFHCRESIHFSPRRMWYACQLVWKMNVDEALVQLEMQQLKGCSILGDVLKKAKQRASDEFHIEYPSKMYVADAFPIQSQIIKGSRRHAHENWNTIRYRYINIFVRLEEGPAPGFKAREKPKTGWDKMDDYYEYLRSRDLKYKI